MLIPVASFGRKIIQIELTMNEQSPLVFGDRFTFMIDDSKEMFLGVAILRMSGFYMHKNDNGNDNPQASGIKDDSLFFIFRNKTQLMQQHSENLIFQIPPRDFVTHINKDEKKHFFHCSISRKMFLNFMLMIL